MQTMIKLKFKIQTVAVCGGQEAIDEIQKKINSGLQTKGNINAFKIVFMDCSMPVMDGFEASQKILELCQKNEVEKPYIVALTGYDDAMVATKCIEFGMSEFIQKPVSTDGIKKLFEKNGIHHK